MVIEILPFDQLTNIQLYDCLQLRQDIFVIEQNCIYPDIDQSDQQAHHIIGTIDNKIVSYARIFPPGIIYNEMCSIGRICTDKSYRHHSYGRLIIESAIQFCQTNFPKYSIGISAQTYLLDYYHGFGFVKINQPYLEDGIEHQKMVWRP